MNISLISSILISSLFGSMHCAGMCGGFVMFYSGQVESKFLAHILYNLGRLITYSLLGALAGYAGGLINQLGILAGFQKLAALLTGLLLIIWGVRGLVNSNSLNFETGLAANFFKKLSLIFRNLLKSKPSINWNLKAFAIGLLSTFLPCGWLYAYAAVAASSGNWQQGALIMVVFWLGTVPMMLGIGVFSGIITKKLGLYLPKITAILLIIAGFISIGTHLGLVGGHSHHNHHSQHSDHNMQH
ncbi:MAG: sulfite exporter TauE/SafE family protein [Bdellovibrionales bacterium]|nr:sulfite exporter TauE/SafE family protein [Bdellovibrionales bacterium]